ncbi:hypothetical protein ANO14919_043270 [Xylariales sp. No.14919]|nr:hypothetical protein ANO14919_043270 [Xylariales sp. No.14919]
MVSSMQSCNDIIIFVLGPPGSGKGTVCKAAAGMLHPPGRRYLHLSVGDYLRELCRPTTSCEVDGLDRNRIRNHLRDNVLLPAEVLIPILKHKITSTPKEKDVTSVWLIDGFPRNIETTLAFEEEIGNPTKVITLKCSRDTALERFRNRRREKADNEERFMKRYDEYTKNMEAINKHYRTIMEEACADGNMEQCSIQFLAALPPASSD